MITLTSDFGSPYPAAMKGVIRRHTDAELIDVAHDLPRGDPRAAAFWLRFVLPEFPPAVHCAVVDPGVGTDRDALVVRAGAHVIVAPDNGLAMPPARALAADESDVEVWSIAVDDPASETFHGRDVFAPTAARVRTALDDELTASDGEPAVDAVAEALAGIDDLAPANDPVDVHFPEPSVERDAGEAEKDTDAEDGTDSEDGTDDEADTGDVVAVDGEVLAIDRFGNVITNVPGELVRGRDWVRVNGDLTPVAETFGAVDPGERLVTVGSHGYAECDVNDGRGDGAFDLRPGDAVRFVPDSVSL
ncbi:S-adenosyl-l-methionine hydroxide adenosyltransferase [Halorubrum sp. SD690R]|uniref:S-adenosyl-l-methionine hydroxide adenosyltransferase n=1 Tax=Halorubrum ezzemoulense TaxID=337243 RepID=A0A256J5W7_HALEZ|nr:MULTISPECIES: SAM-dependent chlorinase/fluorinase [Halorubrum]OTF13479.1 S-adenosyl-l-methionine hydroxide adenosyltransferase [Halorubrum sp. SD612]OYR64214.1 S-adenosyl-l-methionine hydroxide adenosyltransferase [Halorubrum ezzemoulense]TKX44451.1 S-adenosyl-l-methionine hydroxide adenosyltransferase [Halorubrum sp. SD690R]